MLKFHQKHYQLYSPPATVAYHLWERAYRKTYKEDHGLDQKRQLHQAFCLQKIKDIVLSNDSFLEDMNKQRGVDLINK